MISASIVTTLSLGSGDFAFIPIGTNFGPATLNYTSNATLSSFGFSSPIWGSFAALANPMNQVIQKTADFLDVSIVGMFTPGSNAGWAGKDPTMSSVRFSINQSGTSISEMITVSSLASGAPEPATMALIGSALVVLGLISRKRLT
jgi:hypothetical protein